MSSFSEHADGAGETEAHLDTETNTAGDGEYLREADWPTLYAPAPGSKNPLCRVRDAGLRNCKKRGFLCWVDDWCLPALACCRRMSFGQGQLQLDWIVQAPNYVEDLPMAGFAPSKSADPKLWAPPACLVFGLAQTALLFISFPI